MSAGSGSGEPAGFDAKSLEEIPWKDSRHPGVRFRPLLFDRESGRASFVLEMAPGASYPAHRHTAGEEILVLEGELLFGGRAYGKGSYIHGAPGSVHAPRTETGCLMFIVLPGPVEELVP